MTKHPMRRALISVSDKEGLIDFARALADRNVEIISTGGTAKAIADARIPVKDVSDITGFPEIMDGRVKTLHPKVHGGLLAVRGNAAHRKAQHEHGIADIDLLAVNLYPFEETVARGADYDEVIENIDVGGPAMIRAAAKNHESVTVVVDVADYATVLEELAANQGCTTLPLRKRLAAKAYARTAAYDTAIARWFDQQVGMSAPDYFTIGGKLAQPLRYGENPHQHAAVYRVSDGRPGILDAKQMQGKELSYNNINDADAALEALAEFPTSEAACCVIVKHANPCGVATAKTVQDAYRKALAFH
jgi:phosphoribosylaminoimidazolecarboxamide formyltransferase / IMP cyclohydrolase